MAGGVNRDSAQALTEAIVAAEKGSLDSALQLAGAMSIKDVAYALVEGFEDTGSPVHNFEEIRDRFIWRWISSLDPVEVLAALVAIDGVYSNDLVVLPHAEDRFTTRLLEASADAVRVIGKHLSYVKDLAGGPDTSFNEAFAARVTELVDGPLAQMSDDLTSQAQQLAKLQQNAAEIESDE